MRAPIERDRSPELDASEKQALVAGNTAFALRAYQELRRAGGNVFYSPLSVSTAMAMVYAGARGNTQVQMADALRYRLSQPALHRGFNWLDLTLAQRAANTPPAASPMAAARAAESDGFRLDMVAAAFLRKGFEPRPSYLALLAEHYGAGVSLMDFGSAPERAREQINAWVAQRTAGRIDELLPPASIARDTRLVLTNAVYFKARWETPFEREQTREGIFHSPGGDVRVPMMKGQIARLQVAEGRGYQALSLPYQGEDMSMVILMPPAGTLEGFEADLSPDSLAAILDALEPSSYGGVVMPRFSFHFEANMGATLQALGMREAFTDAADLSGISERERLRISAVAHEGFIEVTEAGTEAAAATGVVIVPTSLPRYIEVDRPFVFLIRDEDTGSIVFLGRVVDPS